MKIFTPLYHRTLAWSRHPRAIRYLAAVGFVESWIFPIPTAIMLAPMVLADRDRAWRLATVATVASVAGGLFGYLIGHFLFAQIGAPIVAFYHAADTLADLRHWFTQHGAWLVLLAAASPIPYKIVTLTAGLLGVPIVWFLLASVAGRGAQFFLLAAVLRFGGAHLERLLARWVEPLGWGVLLLVGGGYLIWQLA